MLSRYRWKKRLLILIARDGDVRFQQLEIFVDANRDEIKQRFLQVLSFTPEQYYFPGYEHKTGFWLVGYDGGIKAFGEKTVFLHTICSIIDSMPMRQHEILAHN